MPRCPSCTTEIPETAEFCPHCAAATPWRSDVTHLSGEPAASLPTSTGRPDRRPTDKHSPITSWSSTTDIDHGRFAPGTVLDERYRVIGRLGRGGMGEVYRADDLRLGQPVALKFLPEAVDRDPARLTQLHTEVRMARQVSHPNVCRVYDIGEYEGHTFLSMEYVDGEDLASLLRRIGRFPQDRAVELARQICAGLAAAHDRGVVHRDLKPANIMLDGSGRIRITDFGLAGVAGETLRAGTPAYMAPEQLAGGTVTTRSDIYALGLVLYELFTGRRTFQATNLSDLIEQHHAGTITLPTSLVKGLDPTIEAAIMRCLDPEPARRPGSAIAVSAALPGGDPLAAALAAGETPSPEMVAAAGGDSAALSGTAGLAWLGGAVLLVLACVWVARGDQLLARVPLQKPAAVLADRAETLRESFGYTEPVADRASAFQYDQSYLSWAQKHGSGGPGWTGLASGRPAAVRFWYRTSPTALVPDNDADDISTSDPPLVLHGMTLTILDTSGRLLWFLAVPPQKETAPSTAAAHVDWAPLFSAADLDLHAFTETTPSWTPLSYADERHAWAGTPPGTTTPITIQAAGYRGRAVDFKVVGPWTLAGREPSEASLGDRGNSDPIYIYLLLGLASYAAYRQVRRGHADQRGAFRIATFSAGLFVAIWAVGLHVRDASVEQQRLFLGIGGGMFVGAVLYVLYLGLEPFVRRAWPSMLVGLTRLLGGRLRDPIIGRDVLLGVACGAGFALELFVYRMLPARLGLPQPVPLESQFVFDARSYAVALLGCVSAGMQNALFTLFVFAGLRALFEWTVRRARWTLSESTSQRLFIAFAAVAMTIIPIIGDTMSSQAALDFAYHLIFNTVVLVLLLRIGIFATAVGFFVWYVLLRVPLTFDGSALYGDAAWFTVAWLIVLAWAGFRLATAAAARAHLGAPSE